VYYQGNVTMRQLGGVTPHIGNMSWTVTDVSDRTVFITERVFREQDSLERRYEIEQGSRAVLKLDGEPVQNQTTFFWIETNVENGSLVQVENFTFTVVNQETLTVGNLSRPCWVLNGTFNTGTVEGLVTRWYDVETGLMLKVFMVVGFHRGGDMLEGAAFIGAVHTNAWEPEGRYAASSAVEVGAVSLAAGGLLLSVAALARRRQT